MINFEGGPADPATVMRELGVMSEPIKEKTAARRAVVHREERFVPGLEGLEDAFASSLEKSASASVGGYPYANPHRELFELRETVGRAKEELLSKMASLNVAYEDAFDRLYKEARQVILDGHSPAVVSKVISAISPHPNFTKLALKRISQNFDADHPAIPGKTKVAGMINMNHPLCTTFNDFVKVASDYFRTSTAAEDLAEQYPVVDAKVREVLQ